MGLTCLIKLVRFLYLIFAVLYHFGCIDVSFYFLVHYNSRFSLATISQFLSKIQIIGYFYVDMHNLVKIGRSAGKLLRIFDFQNGGRPPFWTWYDVIADHLQL